MTALHSLRIKNDNQILIEAVFLCTYDSLSSYRSPFAFYVDVYLYAHATFKYRLVGNLDKRCDHYEQFRFFPSVYVCASLQVYECMVQHSGLSLQQSMNEMHGEIVIIDRLFTIISIIAML